MSLLKRIKFGQVHVVPPFFPSLVSRRQKNTSFRKDSNTGSKHRVLELQVLCPHRACIVELMERGSKRRTEVLDEELKQAQESESEKETICVNVVDSPSDDGCDYKEMQEADASTKGSRVGELASQKKRARRIDLTFDRIQPLFKLPIKDAAVQLETSVNTLKRAAREHGIPSWPCRDVSLLIAWFVFSGFVFDPCANK